MAKINDKIAEIKRKYDVARTSVAVAEEKKKECVRQMKDLGVTPKNIKKKIKELKATVTKDEAKLNEMLDDINERIG